MNRAKRATEKFMIYIGVSNQHGQNEDIAKLIEGAFALYARAWDCHDHDVRQWQWPYNEWPPSADRRGGPALHPSAYAEHFVGNEPWTVLFREALRLHATARHTKAIADLEAIHFRGEPIVIPDEFSIGKSGS